MITGDGAYIKKINRGIILHEIIKNNAISRADLAKITGLNKATISVQVADLLKEELIVETEIEHNSVGRRPILLSIRKEAGYVLGIDLDYASVLFTVANLNGIPVEHETVPIQTDRYEEIVQLLIEKIRSFQQKYEKATYGLMSVTIGIHGTVRTDEKIFFVPKYNWQQKDLKSDLKETLNLPIFIENNANLAAFAEKVYAFHEADHLLAMNLTSGIGAGMMFKGTLLKGYNGFAGEMGHMIIVPQGKLCRCGNRGCWELYASETSFVAEIAKTFGSPQVTKEDIKKMIEENDPTVLEKMQQWIEYLATGLNNVINIYNPEILVISSELLKVYPKSIQRIEEKLVSSVSDFKEIALSSLGKQSAVLGACAFSIQNFLQIPQLMIPTKTFQQTLASMDNGEEIEIE